MKKLPVCIAVFYLFCSDVFSKDKSDNFCPQLEKKIEKYSVDKEKLDTRITIFTFKSKDRKYLEDDFPLHLEKATLRAGTSRSDAFRRMGFRAEYVQEAACPLAPKSRNLMQLCTKFIYLEGHSVESDRPTFKVMVAIDGPDVCFSD